jgi:hypothetical protein
MMTDDDFGKSGAKVCIYVDRKNIHHLMGCCRKHLRRRWTRQAVQGSTSTAAHIWIKPGANVESGRVDVCMYIYVR